MKRSNWCVYKHTFQSGKIYIGITSKSPEERWKDGFGYDKQRRLFKEIVRNGWDSVKHEILFDGLDEVTARKIESKLIDEAFQTDKENLLNTQRYKDKKKREPKNADNSWRMLHRNPLTCWTIDGITKPARDWCEEFGVTYGCIKHRIDKHGLTPEQAISLPPVPQLWKKKPLEYWASLGLVN